MAHPIVHFEIGCRDKAKTAEFFSKLFDWKIEDEGPAARIRNGEDVGGDFRRGRSLRDRRRESLLREH